MSRAVSDPILDIIDILFRLTRDLDEERVKPWSVKGRVWAITVVTRAVWNAYGWLAAVRRLVVHGIDPNTCVYLVGVDTILVSRQSVLRFVRLKSNVYRRMSTSKDIDETRGLMKLATLADELIELLDSKGARAEELVPTKGDYCHQVYPKECRSTSIQALPSNVTEESPETEP
jgi:hypothetical protein